MKPNFSYGAFFVLFAVFSFCALPHADAQGFGDRNRISGGGSYTINGKVMLPDGKPASGVRVSLSGADFTNPSTQTDNDGNFQFGSIPAGNYNVTVRGTNEYESENEPITIGRETPQGQNFNVMLYLRLPGTKKADKNNPLIAGVPKEALKKYQSAAESLKKNDTAAALAALDEAIAIHPNFALALNEKGILLMKQNQLDKALEVFSKAVQASPEFFEAKLNFGVALLQMKDFAKSETVFRDVLKLNNDAATAHLYLGISLLNQKNVDEAESELKKAISIKGGENLAMAHKYLGGIYWQKKQYAEAVKELEKYVELSPKAADVEKIKTTIADLKKQHKLK